MNTLRKTRVRICVLILAAVPLWALGGQEVATRGQPTYSLTDLGAFDAAGESYSRVGGINNAGAITGQVLVLTAFNTFEWHAFIYSRGTMYDIGGLPGLEFAEGFSINSRGQVVGAGWGGPCTRAFLYTNGAMLDLGALGGNCSLGSGINARGAVTGWASTPTSEAHAFLYQNGVMQDLDPENGGNSFGNAINDAGDVTGSSSYPYSTYLTQHAFLYRHGVMSDLGTLGGAFSEGLAINSADQITGDAETSAGDGPHAFLYSHGAMRDLGTGYGLAINNSGQVVGYAYYAPGGAFLYSNGVRTPLAALINPSDPLAPYVQLFEATGINNRGLIVANGFDSRRPASEVHAYLLTPSRHTEIRTR